jgi:threonine 3-dehydrogenase
MSSAAVGSERILVTGAIGQIGLELLPALRAKFGENNVFATDVRKAPSTLSNGPWRYVDVLDVQGLSRVVVEENISTIIHLAAILSATGEANPHMALKINNEGTQNVFEVCRLHNLKLFVPSTIAVFGPTSPKMNTPDDCQLRPTTMYGITKIHTELLSEYYNSKYGLDVRSLRYPGVISAYGMPGGGTTDYAVDIYHKAVTQNSFNCFLKENTALPMMYMPDLLKATIDLLTCDPKRLTRRVYNLAAFSFTPAELAASIRKRCPGFSMT